MFDLSTIDTESPWEFSVGSNPEIDFCVWVLQVDGLQVPPFNHHPPGNQALQEAGLDVQTWAAWLTSVVASQDNRLGWSATDMAALVERHLASEEQRAQFKKYLRWQEQQYQAATSVLGPFPKQISADSVWQDDADVQERLEGLRRDYSSISRDMDRPDDLDVIGGFYEALRQQFQQRLSTLKVELVHYPVPVFFPVPPVTVLVSKVKEIPLEPLRVSLFQAVEALTE